MDAIRRAEQVLSAAGLRHPHACLPGGAFSPADRLGTMTLARDLIAECDAAAKRAKQVTKEPENFSNTQDTQDTVHTEAADAAEAAQLQQLLQPDLGRSTRRHSA